MQVSSEASVKNIINGVLKMQGAQSFLFRSYLVIIIREIPFDCIQYFIWETLKEKGQKCNKKIKLDIKDEIINNLQ